jgi:putative spermidine/putrescine transport system permease protein
VTLPLARTGIVSGAIFAFAVSMDDVSVSIMLTDSRTYTLPIALVSSMRANFDLSIAAASVMLTGLTFMLIVVLDRLVGVNRAIGQGMFR